MFRALDQFSSSPCAPGEWGKLPCVMIFPYWKLPLFLVRMPDRKPSSEQFPEGTMNQGSSDRIPVSSLILFASLVFTLTTYFTFKVFWEVDIHVLWLFAVLGLQLAVLLLGGSKVLTRLGAAALSALIAVAVCIGALFIFFPPILELRIAGAVGGGTALIFIMASFVAASRVDPVPSGASEPLVMGKIEDDQMAELIKYGAVHGTDPMDTQYPPVFEEPHKEVVEVGQPVHTEVEPPPNVKETVYEFDELSESKLGFCRSGRRAWPSRCARALWSAATPACGSRRWRRCSACGTAASRR